MVGRTGSVPPQLISFFSHCHITSVWDVFFTTVRNKFNSQDSYYSNGVRHIYLISVLAFLESFVSYVSCCVQNSHLFNKTVPTPVHPPGNLNCQFSNQNIPALQSFFLLKKKKKNTTYLVPILISRFSAKLLLGSVTHFTKSFRIE